MKITGVIAVLSLFSTYLLASPLPDFPFIVVEGQAEIELAPNIATVRFTVEAFEEDPDDALTTVQNRSVELGRLFHSQKIAREDIVAFQIDKDVVRAKNKSYQELAILGYEFTREFSITIRDLSNYEQFISKLLRLENVVRFRAHFDRTDQEKVEADLVSSASADARQKAEKLAKGFGREVGSVYAVSQTGFRDLASEFGFTDMAYGIFELSDLDDPQEFELFFVPSTIRFQKNVKAVFEFEDAD